MTYSITVSETRINPVFEFNEFKPRLKFTKNRFQLSVGLNLEKLNTILSGTNHIWLGRGSNSLNSASGTTQSLWLVYEA